MFNTLYSWRNVVIVARLARVVGFTCFTCLPSGGKPMTIPTSWSDFPSHAGVPKLIPNPIAVDNVSKTICYKLLANLCKYGRDAV